MRKLVTNVIILTVWCPLPSPAGGYMDGAQPGPARDLAFELADAKKELSTLKAAELTAALPPPSIEAQLEEDLIRVASDISQGSAAAAPAPAAVYSSS